jgi:nitrous oxidase accessory protein NosD
MENANQTISDGSQNSWDNDYPSGGNYWSDYRQRYANATEIDGSGLWDSPYLVDALNKDNYPVIPEFTSPSLLMLLILAAMLPVVVCKRKERTQPLV